MVAQLIEKDLECIHTSQGTKRMKITVAVAVSMDGTKLPLFVVFKGSKVAVSKEPYLQLHFEGLFVAYRSRHRWMHLLCNFGTTKYESPVSSIHNWNLHFNCTTIRAIKVLN